MRRTRSGALSFQAPARYPSPLAKALSLLSVCSVLAFAAPLPLQAADAATITSIESPKAVTSLLLDIAHAGKRLVAVGDRGHILFSEDAGRNWVQARVPSRQLLTAVYFVDDKHGWAVGHDAQILASDDGGANWELQHEDLEREAPLLDIWFRDTSTGYAVGAYGALLETSDGGKTWNDVSDRLDNEDGYHLNGITAVKDAGLFVVGEAGSMFRSADWGQTWEKVQGPYEGTLFGALGTASANTLVAYGLRGNLFRSTDFGKSWQQIKLLSESGPLEFGLANGSLLKDGTLVIVGHGGSVLTSKDAGRAFTVVNRADRASLAGATDDAAGNLVLVGQGGVHLATPTGVEPGKKQ
ncbi:YCF48-related protein [Pseudomonas alcaligenes]|uniref:YCF48-related protein n=2 Tax=Aquipseudomonas alcaligenes TaxID=43263 RepID=A0AA42MWP0_AQUAC|nr:YCF48-related protein [Pseudomonas alcaligenes]MDH1053148.1 YCF48-related protein [Pseudomonas alcaligenes]